MKHPARERSRTNAFPQSDAFFHREKTNVPTPDATTSVVSLKVQLLGIAGVLLVTLAIAISLTVVITGIKGNATLTNSTTGKLLSHSVFQRILISSMEFSDYADHR